MIPIAIFAAMDNMISGMSIRRPRNSAMIYHGAVNAAPISAAIAIAVMTIGEHSEIKKQWAPGRIYRIS